MTGRKLLWGFGERWRNNMIKFHQLKFNNFMNYTSETTIDLDNQGLTLIIGKTGSGKSTIHTAITFSLFGSTARGIKVDQVINDMVGKDCYVSLLATVNDKELKITRYRGHNLKGNALEVEYDGKPVVGRVTEIQDQLENNILHMTFDQFTLSTLFSQDKIKYFAAETPTNRLKIFESLLSLEKFERAYRLSHDKLLASSKTSIALESKLVTLQRRVPEIELLIKETEEKDASWKEKKRLEVESLKNKLDIEEDKYRQLGSLEEPNKPNLSELEENSYSLNTKLVTLSVTKTGIEQSLRGRKSIEDLIGKECPTCTEPITPEKAEKVKISEDKRLKELEDTLPSISSDITIGNDKLKRIRERILNLTRKYEEKSNEYRTWLSKKSMLEFNMHQMEKYLESKIAEVNPHTDMVETFNKQMKNLTEELQITQRVLEEENKIGAIFEATKGLFSRKGLRFYYIKQCIKNLEIETRKVLNSISNGRYDFLLNLDENEELQLTIFINGKEKDYSQCSHGEKHCVNCALVFGFNKMIKQRGLPSTNIMFLDEILDLSMDDELTESTYRFLEQLKEEVSSVFVISHKEAFKALFPKTWEIEGGKML
jgi:DNA repair exonuclease SbcCD ATPase subunit